MNGRTPAILVAAGLLLAGVAAEAQIALPGMTLKKPGDSQAGSRQPAKNAKNIIGPINSRCIYGTWTLQQLLAYARLNHQGIYRQAVGLVRGSVPKEDVRVFLLTNICLAESLNPPEF